MSQTTTCADYDQTNKLVLSSLFSSLHLKFCSTTEIHQHKFKKHTNPNVSKPQMNDQESIYQVGNYLVYSSTKQTESLTSIMYKQKLVSGKKLSLPVMVMA